jgi:hypothetical protein
MPQSSQRKKTSPWGSQAPQRRISPITGEELVLGLGWPKVSF